MDAQTTPEAIPVTVTFLEIDCVEVAPPFDPAAVTAFVAANACFEMLSLLALRR